MIIFVELFYMYIYKPIEEMDEFLKYFLSVSSFFIVVVITYILAIDDEILYFTVDTRNILGWFVVAACCFGIL